jgi:hypothetical protein
MLTAPQHAAWFLVVVATVLFASPLSAIQPPDVPTAPIPVQILSAHKVFISNGESTGIEWPPTLVYDAFYAGMKNWGKYELVSTPVDADVVFEVRYLERIYTAPAERVQILVLDPKTHVTLWQFMEPIQNWARDDTGRKNFGLAMDALMNDVKKLVAGPGDKH